jgi:hypothetical protein
MRARRAGSIALAAALAACAALPTAASADHGGASLPTVEPAIADPGTEVLRHGDPRAEFADGVNTPDEPGPSFESAVPGTCPIVDRVSDDIRNSVFPAGTPTFKVIYAYPTDVGDRLNAYGPILQAGIKGMSDLVESESGGALSLRFDLGTFEGPGCVDIQRVALPQPTAAYLNPATSFDRVASDVFAKLGQQPAIRNYLVYADAVPLPGIAGTAERYNSDAVDGSTTHNHGNLFAVLYGRGGTDFFTSATPFAPGTTSRTHVEIALHEVTHNLGAVQNTAPHSSGHVGVNDAGHCYDEYDLMCYNDGGDEWVPYVDPNCDGALTAPPDIYSSAAQAWDCNKDDYFSVNPAPGSYLDTHWNAANSVFLCPILTCTPPDTTPPETFIDRGPAGKTHAKRVKVFFSATERATFVCRLDRRAPRPCVSPFKVKVKNGKNRVRVAATDRAGIADASPASTKFRRVRRR